MTEKENEFWNRILELARNHIKETAFEFYISEASLLSIEDHYATILLTNEIKQLFWDQNLKNIVLTAGFEIFDKEIKLKYQFADSVRNTSPITSTPILKNRESEEIAAFGIPDKQPIKSDILPQYTFENFVQGENNLMSYSAALAVSDKPGTTYNPLFIYGGPGLGKTHLLHAIGNQVIKDRPTSRIKYVTAETFLNDFLEHLRLNKMEEFKKIYRHLDILLIDDIQSLNNKMSTLEEFFHTFNALHNDNRQIVLTSDRNPDNLDNLEQRLVTRFKWGLTSEITSPDFETRVAILINKCAHYPYQFTTETLHYLAGQFDSNIRDLEGALKNIDLIANMQQLTEITVEIAAQAIRSRRQTSSQTTVIPIERIQEEVAHFYGISVKELKGSKRVQHIAFARQIAIYLAREMTDNSTTKIGKEFGNRDHSTVLHAYNKIKNRLSTDSNLEIEMTSIRNKIR